MDCLDVKNIWYNIQTKLIFKRKLEKSSNHNYNNGNDYNQNYKIVITLLFLMLV